MVYLAGDNIYINNASQLSFLYISISRGKVEDNFWNTLFKSHDYIVNTRLLIYNVAALLEPWV